VPKWIILDGEPAEKRQGINMLSRAQEGYFGPTNKENVDGAVKCKYLTRPEERIEHPAFVRKKNHHCYSCTAIRKRRSFSCSIQGNR